jgi:hypothetical protein
MATLGISATTLTTIAAVTAGTAAVVGAAGSIYAGAKAAETAEIIARQEEQQGKDEFAASQTEARERALEGKLIQSRQQAIAAASGAGASTDAPSIVTLMRKTAERTKYGMDTAQYAGARRRDALNASAAARRRTGSNEFVGSLFTAAGTLAGGVGRVGEIVS